MANNWLASSHLYSLTTVCAFSFQSSMLTSDICEQILHNKAELQYERDQLVI